MKISVLCLLIAGVLPLISTAIAKWGFRDFDNHYPREWLARQTGFRARANAAKNGLANVEFHAADLAKDLSAEPWMKAGFDKLLLDPPRAGAAEVLAQLPLKGIRRIVYVSCHPGSLARDAGFLVRERGYKLVAAGAMDMFPQTAHVESIALFEK